MRNRDGANVLPRPLAVCERRLGERPHCCPYRATSHERHRVSTGSVQNLGLAGDKFRLLIELFRSVVPAMMDSFLAMS